MKSPGQVVYEAFVSKWAELQRPNLHAGYDLLPSAPWDELSDDTRACWDTAAVALLETI